MVTCMYLLKSPVLTEHGRVTVGSTSRPTKYLRLGTVRYRGLSMSKLMQAISHNRRVHHSMVPATELHVLRLVQVYKESRKLFAVQEAA